MNKFSLRIRLTLATGLIVFITSIILCVFSANQAMKSIDYAVYLTNAENQASSQDNNLLVGSVLPDNKTATFKAAVLENSSNREQTIQDIINKLYVYDFFIALLASGIGMLIAYNLVKFALKPLNEFSDKMLNTSIGSLDKTIEGYDYNNEIGDLAYAFNKMIKRLQDTFLKQKRFSANVAHELKTPLTIMKTSYQILDADDSYEEYQKAVKLNLKNINHLIEICDDLLEYSNDGAIKMNEVINVDASFKDVINELKIAIEEMQITVVEDVDDTVVVMGNYQLFYRMIYNLVENAIKYGKTNGHIYFVCQKDFNKIVIIIGDDGIGISQDSLSHIFEPFYRVNQLRSKKYKSAGIGLAFVKNVVDKHGWKIRAESVLDKKTQFIIEM